MAAIACKLAKIEVGRKPGRTLLAETLDISVFMNHSGRLLFWVQRGAPQFSQLLKKDPVKLTLPWFASYKDVKIGL